MMRKLSFILLLCAAGSSAILCTLPAPVEAGDDVPKKVRVGLVKTLFRDAPEPVVMIVMRPFKTFLEAQTGSSGEIVVSPDADTLGQSLKDDKVQIGVFHGYEFAWAKQKNPGLKALVLAVNVNTVQHAVLVVRQDCKAQDCCDLKGQVLAYPAMNREHCKMFLENRCVKSGTAPKNFYSEMTAPGNCEEALDWVVDGDAKATVIDDVAFEDYKNNKPGRAKQLRTLLESEAFPSGVIAYNPAAVNAEAVERFRKSLLSARDTAQGKKLLDMCRITSFEAVPADYDKVFSDIAKAYPQPVPK
jgi:ABC-type phosphate/phosphonate transport system substrate-binding protein